MCARIERKRRPAFPRYHGLVSFSVGFDDQSDSEATNRCPSMIAACTLYPLFKKQEPTVLHLIIDEGLGRTRRHLDLFRHLALPDQSSWDIK